MLSPEPLRSDLKTRGPNARLGSLVSRVLPPDPCVLAFLFYQHTSVENTPSLQSSATLSMAATSASSATSSGLSLPSSINTVNSLCLGGTTVSAPSSSTRATPLVTSGVCPRGLSHLLPSPQRCASGFQGGCPEVAGHVGSNHTHQEIIVSLQLCLWSLILSVPVTSGDPALQR